MAQNICVDGDPGSIFVLPRCLESNSIIKTKMGEAFFCTGRGGEGGAFSTNIAVRNT